LASGFHAVASEHLHLTFSTPGSNLQLRHWLWWECFSKRIFRPYCYTSINITRCYSFCYSCFSWQLLP